MIIKILISIGCLAWIVSIVAVFRDQFLSKEKIKSNSWLHIFFSVMPAMIIFFYNIFRIIQFFVIGCGTYIIVEGWAAFGIPTGFFALTFGGLLLEPFIGKRFFIEKLGKVKGEKYYKDSIGVDAGDSRTYKECIAFLVFLGIVSAIAISFGVYDYTKVTKEGIYINKWSSFKGKLYSWDKVDKIYLSTGNSEQRKDPTYPYYSIIMKDGTESRLDSNKGNRAEVHNRDVEAVEFISGMSNVRAEKKP
jgi:hypothetical protein